MRAERLGFVGPLSALPVSAAAALSSRIGGRRSSTSTRRPLRSTGGRAAHHTHPLRASATPPARPAATSARPSAATEASRRGRPEGGSAAPPSPSPPPPSSSSSAASAKRRAAGTTSSPSTSAASPPPTPPPLSSAAAADAASRAAAAAYAANLGTVIETLRSDYPHLLTRPPVGSIYTPDVAFVSAGLTTAGAGAYGALWWAVRSVARLVLVRGEVAITSLYADASAGRVYVRWRLTGTLRGGGGEWTAPTAAAAGSWRPPPTRPPRGRPAAGRQGQAGGGVPGRGQPVVLLCLVQSLVEEVVAAALSGTV